MTRPYDLGADSRRSSWGTRDHGPPNAQLSLVAPLAGRDVVSISQRGRLSMSSPKSPSRETREEKMKPRSLRTCSKGHKTASHGVLRCQGTGTSLTALSSHGKRETSSANSLKKGQHPSQASGHLSCSVAVERLRFLKGGRSIGLMRFEQSEHNARPNVRKRSDSD